MAKTSETDEQQYQYKCPVMGGATCLEEDCGFLDDAVGAIDIYHESGCPIANAVLRVHCMSEWVERFCIAYENIHHNEISRYVDGSAVNYEQEERFEYIKRQREKKEKNNEIR